jgi:signal transduction histidine kinase
VYESKTTGHTYLVKALGIDEPGDGNIALLISDITRDIKIEEMEKTIKMHEELFANVSHELKTPLNVIFSANQLMEMYLKSESNNNSKKLLRETSVIKQNCYRLTRLVNNIVDLSKYEKGHLKLKLKNVNIVKIVEDIAQSVSDYVKGKGLEIIFDTNTEEKFRYFGIFRHNNA